MDSPEQSSRWLRWWITAGLFVLLAGVWIATTACHGHVIRRDYAPNHGADFNFKKPPCVPSAAPETSAAGGADDEVLLRYLGVSGIYVRWQDHALLTAPFFSDYPTLHAGFKSIRWRLDRIRRGMEGIPLDPAIAAVLVGHSHYDHIGDLPPIIADWAPDAELWVNASGRNMLAGCADLADNTVRVLQEVENGWVTPLDADGRPTPFRILALPAGHASHLLGKKLAGGTIDEPWDDCLEGRKVRRLVDGTTYAFLIDLLDAAGETVFRIHYQDAASDAPLGFPPPEETDHRPADLAIVWMPSWYNVEDYPRGLLEASHARHVLVTHYEDFVGDEPKLHFVPLLTDKRANGFMEIVRTEMATSRHAPTPPLDDVCGPAAAAWSMPLPGEWLRFRAGP